MSRPLTCTPLTCTPLTCMARAALALTLVALTSAGCAAGEIDLNQARSKMRSGRALEVCDALERMAGAEGPRAEQLHALRAWVECLARTGALKRADELLARRAPQDGGRLYAEALVQVASSPARLPAALIQLERAGKRWSDQAEIPYRAGVLLLADDRPAEAIVQLKRASRIDDTADAAVARAHALLDLGRTTAALELARRVPRLKPGARALKRGKALIARIARRTRHLPPAVVPRFRQALDLLHRHDRAGACIRKVEELLMDHPRVAAAYTLLGLANFRLGNLAAAVVALRQGDALNRFDATNPLYLALIYQQRGRREQAMTYFKRALALDPFHTQATRELGRILLATGRTKEAADVLERLAALDGSATGLRLAGRAHFEAGALDKAEHFYSQLLKKNPKDFELNLRLGQIMLKRFGQGGDRDLLEQATRHAKEAAIIRPEDPELDQLLREIKRSFK